MPRKRINLGPALDGEIAARTARGEVAETIYEAIGHAISVPTIRRRQAELRGKRALTASSVRPSAVPGHGLPVAPSAEGGTFEPASDATDIPVEIDESTPVEMLDRWIARVEEGARKAEEASNLAALSSLAMRAASLAEARRKAMPLPKPDPNDNPDYRALGEQVEKRFFALIDEHLGKPGSVPGLANSRSP